MAAVSSAVASVTEGKETIQPQTAQPSVTVLESSVFYADPYRTTSVDVAAKLAPKWQRRIPFRSAQFAMVELRCSGVTPSGVLSGCKVTNVEPKGLGYEPVAVALPTALKTTKADARRVGFSVEFILVQVKLSNSDVRPWKGPCWPPTCNIIPAPPQPPVNVR